jgi:ribosome-associated protein
VRLPLDELTWSFVRAGGPGGQNVNKVASKAVARWDVAHSRRLPAWVKARLAPRLTASGELVVASDRYRDQARNRDDVIAKLAAIVASASAVRKARRPSKPSAGAREARLADKRRRSLTKQRRQREPE